MTKESGRKCSHCGNNGHNSRTCNDQKKAGGSPHHLKLFGVKILKDIKKGGGGGERDELMKKSLSMGNLHSCNSTANASSSSGIDHHHHHQNSSSDRGYLSDGGLQGRSEALHERRRGVPWTEEEHATFLEGLEKLGKGDWRGISKKFVTTRTPTQVASHAQKYFLRQATPNNKKKRRSSLFDVSSMKKDHPPAFTINPLTQITAQQQTPAAAAARNSSEAHPPIVPNSHHGNIPSPPPPPPPPPPHMAGISGGSRLSYTASTSSQNFSFPALSLVPVMNFPINRGYFYVPAADQTRFYNSNLHSNNNLATTSYGLVVPAVVPPHHHHHHHQQQQLASSSSTSPTSTTVLTPSLNVDQSVNTDLELSIAQPRPRTKLSSETSNLSGAISVV